MKKFIILFTIVVISCIGDNPKLTIRNETLINYDSIKVYSSEHTPTVFKDFHPNTTRKGYVAFNKNNVGDGAYNIQIYNDGKLLKQMCFGYFTNGKSLNRLIYIEIKPDTIIVAPM